MNCEKAFVTFGEERVEKDFELLKKGKFEDKKLYRFIEHAIVDLKKDPASGVKLAKSIWPKDYTEKYNLTNLWKYDLPNSWRLIYTIKKDETMILCVILEWFDHKGYERRFKY